MRRVDRDRLWQRLMDAAGARWFHERGIDPAWLRRIARGEVQAPRILAEQVEQTLGISAREWPILEPRYDLTARGTHVPRGVERTPNPEQSGQPLTRRGRHYANTTDLTRWLESKGQSYVWLAAELERRLGRRFDVCTIQSWNAGRNAAPTDAVDVVTGLSDGAVGRGSWARVRP